MNKFEVGQEVIILDGTSLVGRIVEVGDNEFAGELMTRYRVALDGNDGRWYDTAELAAPPTAQPAASATAADDSGLPADWIPSDELDSLDYAVAMLESEFMKNGRYSAVRHHFKSIDEWHSEAMETEADLRAKLASAEALADTRLRELVLLEGERNRLRVALKPFAFCPIHPSWSDDTRCVILMNWNDPGLEVSINEGLKLGDIRNAANALAANAGEGE